MSAAPIQPVTRVRHVAAHMTFEIITHPGGGIWFSLIAGEAVDAMRPKSLFDGPVGPEMPAQLRALADQIEATIVAGARIKAE